MPDKIPMDFDEQTLAGIFYSNFLIYSCAQLYLFRILKIGDRKSELDRALYSINIDVSEGLKLFLGGFITVCARYI